jgi:hypothetical protein
MALAGPRAPSIGSPSAFYQSVRPAFIGLLLGMLGEGSFEVQLMQKMYGEAFKYIENAAILMAAQGLLKGYDNFASIDFIDTGGDPFGGVYFFGVGGSFIEGNGFNDIVSLNQVWLIGPNQINAATDVLSLFQGLPSKPNWKDLKEVWNFFKEVYDKLKDAVGTGQAAAAAFNEVDQPPDGFDMMDFCALSDTCEDLLYSNGFKSVYSTGAIPAPVLLIYKNLETGYFNVQLYNFFSQ